MSEDAIRAARMMQSAAETSEEFLWRLEDILKTDREKRAAQYQREKEDRAC